jgi:N-acetylmuramoyl-L-alanine amidase
MILEATMCLALNMFYEARNENFMGRLMVAEVTLNRVAADNFPDTVCEVVWQDKQFSWTHDGLSDDPKKLNNVFDRKAWDEIQRLAMDVILYPEYALLGSNATHYHTVDVEPYWAKEMSIEGKVGKHIFYTEE